MKVGAGGGGNVCVGAGGTGVDVGSGGLMGAAVEVGTGVE